MSALAELDLGPREAAAELVEAHGGDPRWLDDFADALERQLAGRELRRILRVWDLSQSEAGRLFGVSRQAVSKWLNHGIPADRAEQVADLSAATDLLVHYLKRERIPAVVRREAAALGGRSLVDLLAAGQTRRLLEACRDMFAFADVQA